MPMKYRESFHLDGGHEQNIACLAFSPDRSLLASGGLEGSICIWDVKSTKLLASCKETNSASVLSCIWKPGQNDLLLCGLRDGSVVEVTLTSNKISLIGFSAHKYPVEKLAMCPDFLASGAQKEVKIWQPRGEGKWGQATRLEQPEKRKKSREVLVTGLFFTRTKGYSKVLLVAFMHHGVHLYDCATWSLVRSFSYEGVIGNCSLHPDGSLLGISDCTPNFIVHDLLTDKRKRYRIHGLSKSRALPVLFVHEGYALLTGSTTGEARLWDVASKGVYNTFTHGKGSDVLALAACHSLHADRKKDTMIVATASTSPAGGKIIVWIAQETSKRKSFRSHESTPWSTYAIDYISQLLIIVLGILILHFSLKLI